MACLKHLLNEKLGLSAMYPNNSIHLMSTAAVLPLSTAEVERVFSQVKLVKCDHINRMKQVTMNNMLARISKGQGAGPEKGLSSALLDFQKRHFLGTL
jgi:hypothetical protein